VPFLAFALARQPASFPAGLVALIQKDFSASALFSRDQIRRQRFVEENASWCD